MDNNKETVNFQSLKNKENKNLEEDKNLSSQENEVLDSIQNNEESVEDGEEDFSYIRVDCEDGYLDDEVEIRTYKITQTCDVAQNYLLGDYDSDGNYIMNTDVLRALVGVSKYVVNAFGDVVFLESATKFENKGIIRFSISFSKGGANNTAILKVLEPISKLNNYIINTHSYVVATYTDLDNEDFLKKVYKVFNVYSSVDDAIGKDDPELVALIINRIKMISTYLDFMLVDLDNIHKAYYLKRLEILKDSQYEEILNELYRLQQKTALFVREDDPLYYYYQSQLLDLALDNIKILNPELYYIALESMRGVMENFANLYETKHKTDLQKTAEALNVKGEIVLGASQDKPKSSGKGRGNRKGNSKKKRKGNNKKKKDNKDKTSGGEGKQSSQKNSNDEIGKNIMIDAPDSSPARKNSQDVKNEERISYGNRS